MSDDFTTNGWPQLPLNAPALVWNLPRRTFETSDLGSKLGNIELENMSSLTEQFLPGLSDEFQGSTSSPEYKTAKFKLPMTISSIKPKYVEIKRKIGGVVKIFTVIWQKSKLDNGKYSIFVGEYRHLETLVFAFTPKSLQYSTLQCFWI